MIAELEKRTRAEFGEEPASHVDYAEVWIASGGTLLELARDISVVVMGKEQHDYIRREVLSKYLNGLEGQASADTLSRARARGAHALAEGARQLAKDTPANRDAVAAAKLEIETTLWLAERWNREELGQQRGPNVSITFNALHLDALRARATAVASVPAPALAAGDSAGLTTETVDAEVIEVVEASALDET